MYVKFPCKSGVYKIINIADGKFYIGSSNNLRKRFANHKSNLKSNRHPNTHLQRSINKYGLGKVKIEVLCYCPTEYLLKMEQWFIDTLKPVYNVNKTAASHYGLTHPQSTRGKFKTRTGCKLSDEHKNAIREANRGRVHTDDSRNKMSVKRKGKPFTDTHKINISLGKAGKVSSRKGTTLSMEVREKVRQGMKRYSAENKEKLKEAHKKVSETMKKSYTIINPMGEIVHFTGMKQFCKINNLTVQSVGNVIKGKCKQTNGWTAIKQIVS